MVKKSDSDTLNGIFNVVAAVLDVIIVVVVLKIACNDF